MPVQLIAALKYWKLIGLGLLLAALAVQSVRLNNANHRTAIALRDLRESRQALKDLAEQSKRQIELTERNVDRVVEGAKRNPEAEKVERAKLPGSCKSPPEVMSADL